jgi:hypothetical protein
MKITQVLVESAGATVAFAFGRFNPAHQGHIEVWRTVEQAGTNWFIGTNPSTLGPNDPLTFQQKSAWMEEIYPPIAGHIVPEQSVLTLAAYIFKKLRKNERATVAYITDADDWAWSGKLLNQYNGVEGSHGYYKFAQIVHVPSPRVSSATALRDAARADDKVAFYHASGTDPKSKVAGLTYFDTVKQAVEKYPLPVKRAKKVKEQVVTEVSTELRNRYVTRASDDYSNANFAARASKDHPGLDDYSREQEQRAKKRAAGLNRALSDKRTGREQNVAEEQKTVAKTWDQMTSQEKLSGVKGRTVWNEKTRKYYTVFDVPVKQATDEASLATMRDYFAGDEKAQDPMDITKQRLYFAKDKDANPTTKKEFRSQWDYEQWLKQNKLKPISSVKESVNAKGWTLINKSKQ